METYRLQLCKPGFVITPNEKTTKQNQKPKPIKKDHVNLYRKKIGSNFAFRPYYEKQTYFLTCIYILILPMTCSLGACINLNKSYLQYLPIIRVLIKNGLQLLQEGWLYHVKIGIIIFFHHYRRKNHKS